MGFLNSKGIEIVFNAKNVMFSWIYSACVFGNDVGVHGIMLILMEMVIMLVEMVVMLVVVMVIMVEMLVMMVKITLIPVQDSFSPPQCRNSNTQMPPNHT